jgi:hypothetical protein
MSPLFKKQRQIPEDLAQRLVRGERILTYGSGPDLVVAATSTSLLILRTGEPELRLAWHHIASAEWVSEDEIFRVEPVEGYPLSLQLKDLGRLPESVRERVTASIIASELIPIRGRMGARIIFRRTETGDVVLQEAWDEGLSPSDPGSRAIFVEAVARLRADLGI